jgi:RNA-directed DNA polymerase
MEKGKSFDISKEEVEEAFCIVKANKGAAGVDEEDITSYEEKLDKNLYKLWNRMSSGSYFPKAVRGVEIPKKDGRVRLLGIPTVEDRVSQTVVKNRFEPLVEKVFCDNSYGYRPNKSALDCVGKAKERCWKIPWVIEFDIKGLFDNIDHDLLMRAVRKHTQEKWIVLYIERFLKAPIKLPKGKIEERNSGTPQGSVIGPVLANLFMHYAFDAWIIREFPNCPWERYADDGLIHCVTPKQANYVLSKLRLRMREVKLELHPEKTRIVYCRQRGRKETYENESFDFLGYTFKTRQARGSDGSYFETFTPAISKDAARLIRQKVKELCRQASNWTIEELARKLNEKLRGWVNYYGKYRKSEMKSVLWYVNNTLILWVRRNRKKVGRSRRKAYRYLMRRAKYEPGLFYHWTLGNKPTVMMTRAV